MRPFPLLKDPTYTEKEQYTSFDNFWLSKIRDKRDLQLVSFTIRLILLFIPLAIILYLPLPLYIWIPLAVFIRG